MTLTNNMTYKPSMARTLRDALRILTLCATTAHASPVFAQTTYGGIICVLPPVPTVIDVYWNPDSLASEGFNVDRFRETTLRAIAVWNEESRTGRRFRFMGSLPSNAAAPTGAIWIRNGALDSSTCSCNTSPGASNSLAFATVDGAPCYATASAGICMRTRRCADDSLIPWNEMGASPTEYSYEAVLIHELGHAGMSFPDVFNREEGVMFGTLFPGFTANRLHLFPIDQRSAMAHSSLAESRQTSVVPYDWSYIAWGTADTSLGVASTVAPGIGSYTFPPSRPHFDVASLGTAVPATRSGAYGGPWNVRGPSGVALVGTQTLWPRVAVSDYGEVMMTWLQCQEDEDPIYYNLDNRCGCAYAYSPAPSEPSSWQLGHVRTNSGSLIGDLGRVTYAPCAVEYNQPLDQFVVAYLSSSTNGPYVTYTSANPSHFAVQHAIDARAGTPYAALRYIGDLAFVRGSVSDGILTAGAAVGSGQRENAIVQMRVFWNGLYYETGAAVNAAGEGTPFSTGRHFGTAMFGSVYFGAIFWADVAPAPVLRTAWAASIFSPFVLDPVSFSTSTGITSSVNAANAMNLSDGHFAVGFGHD